VLAGNADAVPAAVVAQCDDAAPSDSNFDASFHDVVTFV
jgi:hypothetical protein